MCFKIGLIKLLVTNIYCKGLYVIIVGLSD